MDNYKGIYFNNSKSLKYYEGGAHFSYKELYNELQILYNKKNKINMTLKKENVDDFFLKKNNEKKNMSIFSVTQREKSSNSNLGKTRNKKQNNLSKSDSIDNNNYQDINLNIINNSTNRLLYYKKGYHKMHHNSINKNYALYNKNMKKNLSVIDKYKEKDKQISFDTKYNDINNSTRFYHHKNRSSDNKNIYNHCYLKFSNNNEKKMKKIKTNNNKKKYILNIRYYPYNINDNIYLKNKIRNKLKQNKNHSLINENSMSNLPKMKKNSYNKYIRSTDKNNNDKIKVKKKGHHIKSVDYSSIYFCLNKIKTPNYKNEIISYQKSKIDNETPINNIKTVLNKSKNYEDFLNQVKNNKSSYTKIKQNQLILNKSKKLYNKDSFIKEKFKRDTQSTEYE
jgi:hypothetical protein